MSTNDALKVIGLAKSSHHYRTHPRPPVEDPIPAAQRDHPHRLTAQERCRIQEILTDPVYASFSVTQIYYDLLNKGVYVASLRSFHRVAAEMKAAEMNAAAGAAGSAATSTAGSEAADSKAAAGGVSPARPISLQATAPGQIVCWDVTFLPHVFAGSRFAACVFIDLYSRQIVGCEVDYRESATRASRLCEQVIGRVAAAGGRVCVLHSDNGSAMKSHAVDKVCERFEVVQSFIRPRVSNDNAYIESLFGTLKTRMDYPEVFEDLAHAKRWVARFVAVYNDTGHSGLAGYTPNQVAAGTWREVYQRRVDAKQAYDQAHPTRVASRPAPIGTVPECVELMVYSTKGTHRGGEAMTSMMVG